MTFLNKPELFFAQLNSFKYCYITVTISHHSFVCTQFVLFDPQIETYQVQPLRVRVGLGVMAMKRYSTLYMKCVQKAFYAAITDSPILKQSFNDRRTVCTGSSHDHNLSYRKKMVRYQLDATTITTCLSSLASHW